MDTVEWLCAFGGLVKGSRLRAVHPFCYSTQHGGAYMRLRFFVFYQPVKVNTPQPRLSLFTLCKPPLTVAYPLAKLSLERSSHSSSFLFSIHRHHHVLLRREHGLYWDLFINNTSEAITPRSTHA